MLGITILIYIFVCINILVRSVDQDILSDFDQLYIYILNYWYI